MSTLPLKALTIHQPWASLIAHGAPTLATILPSHMQKTIETRTWKHPAYRMCWQDLAIHASKTEDVKGRKAVVAAFSLDLSEMPAPSGCVIAVAKIREIVHLSGSSLINLNRAMVCGKPKLGLWGFMLDDICVLADPVPCRGFQKIWTLPEEVDKLVRAQMPEGRLR